MTSMYITYMYVPKPLEEPINTLVVCAYIYTATYILCIYTYVHTVMCDMHTLVPMPFLC